MPTPHESQLSQIATGWFRQKTFIAERVMPSVMVPDVDYEVTDWERDWIIPETKTTKKSNPQIIEIDGELTRRVLTAHSLIGRYSMEDIWRDKFKPAGQKNNVRQKTTLATSNKLMLAKEKRVADIMTNSSNYDSDMTETLSGNAQWNDKDNSNPIDDIGTAAESFIGEPPNKLIMGSEVWTKLRQHPDILKAVNGRLRGNASDSGWATKEEVAAIFDIEEVIVGRARYNSANQGADESISRFWGKQAILAYITPMQSLEDPIASFCCTATLEELDVIIEEGGNNRLVGTKGVGNVKITEFCEEFIISKECGYLFQNAVA